jgi:hypothetical protein
MSTDLQELRYPVGRLPRPATLSAEERVASIAVLANLPGALRSAVRGLSDAQLDTPYRDGGWTVRQLVHHVADSHINAYVRMRLALTEDFPTTKPYEEALWAELADARTAPVGVSLDLLESLHARWVLLLKSLTVDDFENRGHVHPAMGRQTVEQILAVYDWHSRHHTAHVLKLREREGW